MKSEKLYKSHKFEKFFRFLAKIANHVFSLSVILKNVNQMMEFVQKVAVNIVGDRIGICAKQVNSISTF